MSLTLLVAVSDPELRSELEALARAAGHRSLAVDGAVEALGRLGERPVDALVLDLGARGRLDRAALEDLRIRGLAPALIFLVPAGAAAAAARVLSEGAGEVLETPPTPAGLIEALARVTSRRGFLLERDRLRARVTALGGGPLVTHSPAMARVSEEIERVASTPRTTALLSGERGVGKVLVARAIHTRSARADGPYLTLACAGRPEAELRFELLGRAERAGLLTCAAGGTLHLTQVDQLPANLQQVLFAILRDQALRGPNGEEQRLDVRLICSTHRDLAALAGQGQFREDLLYRLNVMSIQVPPLRERREDLPQLAQAWLTALAGALGRAIPELTPEALELLAADPWPGNMPELRARLERALFSVEGSSLDTAELGLVRSDSGEADFGERDVVVPSTPPATATPASPGPDSLPLGDRSLRAVEEALIRRVLEEAEGNRSQAARTLGVNRTTLYNKLRRYGIEA